MFFSLWKRFALSLGYIANYGYMDGSGEYYISIDSDKCDACGDCVTACPIHLFEVEEDDYGDMAAVVKEKHRKSLKYDCAPCKPTSGARDLPCQLSCKPEAIVHSW